MACTDVFLVRNDLLPSEFQGMKLSSTYDAYPVNRISLDMKNAFVTDPKVLQENYDYSS